MKLFTSAFIVAACVFVAGCGKSDSSKQSAPAQQPSAPQGEMAGLPPGHPPMNTGANALPPGHPPMNMGTNALPAGHPPMSSQKLSADVTSNASNPKWTVPAGWQPGRQSTIRRGSFAVNGAEGQSADIAVTVFPGDVGGVANNINRWRSQIGLAPLPESQAAALSTKLDVNGTEASMVELTADKPMEGKTQPVSMLVVTIPHANDSWFFKMTGDAPVVTAQKDAFLQFVKSVKW